MAQTIVMIDPSGRLVDVEGTNSESGRMKPLADRMLGGSGGVSSLNYGWNGGSKLVIGKNGTQGDEIELKADLVTVSGDQLTVGGRDLQEIIDDSVDLAIDGIVGTPEQIDVNISYSSDSDESSPRKSCVISLDPEILRRISDLETKVRGLFRLEEVYKIGDGLTIVDEGDRRIAVNLGTGLTFEDDSEEEDRTKVTLDFDTAPVPGSNKPVTSDGIFQAIEAAGYVPPYFVEVDADGNMVLYSNVPPNS